MSENVEIILYKNDGSATPAIESFYDMNQTYTFPFIDNITVNNNIYNWKRDDYIFVEWNSSPDGSGDTYLPGSQITLTSEIFDETDLELWAIWEYRPIISKIKLPNGQTRYLGVDWKDIFNKPEISTDITAIREDLEDYIDEELSNIPGLTVDSTMSQTSENPLQNKVITGEFNNKASAIKIETESSYDTDFSQINDKNENSSFSVAISNNNLGYEKILISNSKNLLPLVNTASLVGEVGGITVTVEGGTVYLNGTCTATVKTWLGFNSGSVLTLAESLNQNDIVTAGLLYTGGINNKSIKSIIRLVDGSNSQISQNITGNGIYINTIEAQGTCPSIRIYLEIPSGAELTNYTITPFCFKGENVTQINTPSSFPYILDVTNYNYISTYPNLHTIQYVADTKTYIDNSIPEVDPDTIEQIVEEKVGNVDTSINNKINAKITYLTPEQYGAKGDGVTDDTQALQSCLTRAGSANVIRALKYYKITQPVQITTNNVNIEINRIEYSGDDVAVKIASRFGNIKIKQINADSGGGVLIKDINNSGVVDSNHFEFNYINSSGDCIKIEANDYWNIVHNIFVVPWLKSTNGCLINAGNNCTENTFIGGKTNCLNGWCINNYWPTNVYTRFSFEKNSSHICYGRAQIIDCRTAEALNSYPYDNPPLPEGIFMKLNKVTEKMGHCLADSNTQCTYTGINLDDVSSFEDTLAAVNQKIADQDPEDDQKYFIGCREIVEYSPGIIENITRYNGDAYTTSTDGSLDGKMIIYWNKKAYVPNHEVIETVTTTPFIPLQTVINNPTYFKIGVANCVINLNDSYCPVGIDSFIVEQTDNYKATIYNKDNVLIFDGENKEAGKYQVKSYVVPISSDIFQNINMPDSRKAQYAHRIRHMYTGSNEEWKVTAIYEGDLIEKKDFSFSIPPVIYTGLNGETKIYYRNVLSPNYLMHWGQYTNATTIKETDDYISLVGTSAASKNISYFIVDRGYKIIANGTTSIKINSVAPSSQTMLCLGDSFISYNCIGPQLKTLFTEDGNTLTLIGTKGTSTSRHEGYAGWKITDFINSEKASQNPFWNSEESNFDFSYYMSSNNFSNLDSVYIQLGTNDCSAATLTNNYTNSINAMQTIISSILEYNSNIKIYLGLTVMPTLISENFAVRYNGIGVSWVMRLNMQRLNEALIKAFSNNSSVKIVATNCVLDSSTDILDNVHPTEDGFKKITQQLYYTMMS